MAALPYVTSPGNVDKALKGIRAASTPDSVSQDFVKTILKIPGGSGDQITSFLKKIGFAGPDGKPTRLYTRFRNQATSGSAAAEALKIGYRPLYDRNEYMHKLSDEELRGLIIEETGAAEDSSVPGLVLSAIKAIRAYADFNASPTVEMGSVSTALAPPAQPPPSQLPPGEGVGLSLSYTINLNLPATSDVAVFNAIFRSLRENLLRNRDD